MRALRYGAEAWDGRAPMMVMRKLTLMLATWATLMAMPMMMAQTSTAMRLTHTSRSPDACFGQETAERPTLRPKEATRTASVRHLR